MTTQHTKGPWQAVFIADQGWTILGPNGQVVVILGEDSIESGDNVAADAHLIASTPELLDALKGYMHAIRHGQDQKAVMAAIKAADDNARDVLDKVAGA